MAKAPGKAQRSSGGMGLVEQLECVEGPNLKLRLIRPDDAPYVFALRTDPVYNQHLSAVCGTVDDQRDWIIAYKGREASLRELYYVIERRNGLRCGLVRLYDIQNQTFTWGSWILDRNKTHKAALESAILVYIIGFELLGIARSVFDVRLDNARVISFHERLGAVMTHQSEQDAFFEYTNSAFQSRKAHFVTTLEGGRKK